MGEKQLLIIGVDPGITAAYAAIDIEGNLIKAHSEKNLDVSEMISHLIELGKPLIIASDKEHSQDFVDKVAVKLGARVITPNYDLKVVEKKDIVKGYGVKNQHEIDALAAALFAFKKIDSLLKKINIFVEHYKKQKIKQQLIEFVVGKGLNIRDATEIIEQPEKEEVRIIKEVVEEKKLREKDFLELYKKYKETKKEMTLLKKQNKKFKNEMSSMKKDYQIMFKQISKSQQDRRMKSLLDFKEKRIKIFDSRLKRKEDEIKSLQNETTNLIYILSNLNKSVLLKKLDNLGLQEWEKRKNYLNISEGDILLVKDPDIVSENVINELRNKVQIILYRKPISNKVEARLPFVFIDSNMLNIDENGYFAIIDNEEFARIKNKRNILDKIVEDYKRERA